MPMNTLDISTMTSQNPFLVTPIKVPYSQCTVVTATNELTIHRTKTENFIENLIDLYLKLLFIFLKSLLFVFYLQSSSSQSAVSEIKDCVFLLKIKTFLLYSDKFYKKFIKRKHFITIYLFYHRLFIFYFIGFGLQLYLLRKQSDTKSIQGLLSSLFQMQISRLKDII